MIAYIMISYLMMLAMLFAYVYQGYWQLGIKLFVFAPITAPLITLGFICKFLTWLFKE